MVKEVSDSIAKLPITKKRLSGAQRRKLKKMLQEIIVSQSHDTPKEKSDSLTRSEAKRIRS